MWNFRFGMDLNRKSFEKLNIKKLSTIFYFCNYQKYNKNDCRNSYGKGTDESGIF